MHREQVRYLLRFLNDIYVNLELTESRINSWYQLLKNQDPATVLKEAEKHAFLHNYPPTVADLIREKDKIFVLNI